MNQYAEWTDEQINEKVAERLGYKSEKVPQGFSGKWWKNTFGKICILTFTTSLDAVMEAVEVMRKAGTHVHFGVSPFHNGCLFYRQIEFGGNIENRDATMTKHPARLLSELFLMWGDER